MQNELIDIYIERYFTKKELIYRLPSDIDKEIFWDSLINYRKQISSQVDLIDQKGRKMWFVINKKITSQINSIEEKALVDLIESTSKEIKEKVIIDALIDEAFNSSVIEGAFSTKRRTKELVEKNIEPKNKSEQMIKNNYHALEYVLRNIHRQIDEQIIIDIYKTLTYNTLDQEDIVEKYRTDAVYIWDSGTQNIIYEGPHYSKVQGLMDLLIKFINQHDSIHPIIKACIIHFYFVYIHPFFDGNGRTARALSYMYLLKCGYNFFKFFSISSVIKEEKSKYYKAIKDVEDYDSDLTYFISFNIEMIIKSIIQILKQFKNAFGFRFIKKELEDRGIILSERMNKALEFYIKSEKSFTTIEEYTKKFKVVYETARTDLYQFEDLGVFTKIKKGKKYIFILNDLSKIIDAIRTDLI